MRADAQPIDLLFRLDQPVPRVGTVEILRRAEFVGDDGVLLGRERADGGDAIPPRAALGQHRGRRRNRRLATPGDVGLIGQQRRLRLRD